MNNEQQDPRDDAAQKIEAMLTQMAEAIASQGRAIRTLQDRVESIHSASIDTDIVLKAQQMSLTGLGSRIAEVIEANNATVRRVDEIRELTEKISAAGARRQGLMN